MMQGRLLLIRVSCKQYLVGKLARNGFHVSLCTPADVVALVQSQSKALHQPAALLATHHLTQLLLHHDTTNEVRPTRNVH